MFKIKKLPYYFFFPLLIISVVSLFFLCQKSIWPEFIKYGIYPREIKGLPGIILTNFIHNDVSHWINNILSFFIMSSFLFYYHRNKAWKIILIGGILTGIITWMIGRPSLHIGMSGLNYVLFSFLVLTGFMSKNNGLAAISFILIFIYGGFVWLLFPIIRHISWEAHLSGFISGIFLGIIYLPNIIDSYKKEKESPVLQEDNDFMLYFDEYGNFIEKNSLKEEMIENS